MMQQKMTEQLGDDDFAMDMFVETAKTSTAQTTTAATTDLSMLGSLPDSLDGQQSVQVDMSEISEKERTRMFKQIHPEYYPIYAEYRRMLLELRHRLWPIISLRKRGLIPASGGINILDSKARCMELFVQCALFYFLLVLEREPTKGHPVFERMLQLQKTVKLYDGLENKFKDQIAFVLQLVSIKLV